MKNKLFFIIIITAFFSGSCQENEEYLYRSSDNIYFNLKDTASSKIMHSFAYTPGIIQDTLFIPVRISGIRTDYARQFKVVIVPQKTTAKPEKHYEALANFYEIPADSGTFSLPVVIYNKDPEMDDSTFVLTLALEPSNDLLVDLVKIPRITISFSNRLEQPQWWIYWMSNLGTYSRVKHQLFLLSSGTTELANMSQPDAYMQIPKTLFHLDQYKSFLSNPFKWVEKQAEYTLTETSNGDYHFYLKNAPEKVILLKKDSSSGIFRFIDENGQFIS